MYESCKSFGLLLHRLAFGGLMLVHGIPKLKGMMENGVGNFPDPLGIGTTVSHLGAVGSEVGCSILLMVGLLTRAAAIPAAFTMAVAAFVVHSADDWGTKEKAVLFLCGYLVLIFTGPGKFSVDHLLFGKKSSEKTVNV